MVKLIFSTLRVFASLVCGENLVADW